MFSLGPSGGCIRLDTFGCLFIGCPSVLLLGVLFIYEVSVNSIQKRTSIIDWDALFQFRFDSVSHWFLPNFDPSDSPVWSDVLLRLIFNKYLKSGLDKRTVFFGVSYAIADAHSKFLTHVRCNVYLFRIQSETHQRKTNRWSGPPCMEYQPRLSFIWLLELPDIWRLETRFAEIF